MHKWLLSLLILVVTFGNSTPEPTDLPALDFEHPVKGSEAAIYLLDAEGVRHHIVDWATYLAYGLPQGEWEVLPDETINRYPLGTPLTRYVTGLFDTSIYVIDNEHRYRLDNTEQMRAWGANPETDITTLPQSALDRYPIANTALELFGGVPAVPDDTLTPPPLAFPDPFTDYTAYLKAWPRPEHDNGRCMHYLKHPSDSEFELRNNIARLHHLDSPWVLVNYVSTEQLQYLAPLFKSAGIMVIWRPFIRAHVVYAYWEQDVAYLRALGMPPYMQLYNEPSLQVEWDGNTIDQSAFLDRLMDAARRVYDAGGYVGLQFTEYSWLHAALERMVAEDFPLDRLFGIPHSYGGNYPFDDSDHVGVLGWLYYGEVFREEVGFVPPLIVGEGGWTVGNQFEPSLPPTTADQHRDYHVRVFDWFRTGIVSNGDPLPDYLFAFCPWLLADATDGSGWYDSIEGDRTMTIEAVASMPDFVRRFSWDSP